MPWIGPAISAGASLLGGALQSGSANDAAREQAAATQAAIAEQKRQYDQTRTDQAPWRDTGSAAVMKLKSLLGLGNNNLTDPATLRAQLLPQFTKNSYQITGYDSTPFLSSGAEQGSASNAPIYGNVSTVDEAGLADAIRNASGNPDPEFGSLNKKFTLADFWDDPVTKASYQMGLDQGIKGINNMAGARGGRNSGATLKALTRFGTDYTGQQAAGSQARYVNDQTNTYNRLAGVSGTGQVATQATSAAGQNMANNISGLTSSLGNARGAAAIASGNAWGGALGNIGNQYQQQSTLNQLLNRGAVQNASNSWGGLSPSYNADEWY